jgi:HAD superfamily hydrolase (TIGR01509 family)
LADAYFIFDLDGTLVDNVYEHVLAWKKALEEASVLVPTWRIHRRIGMSGELLVRELATLAGVALSPDQVEIVHRRHGEIFKSFDLEARPLPGAGALLAELSRRSIAWAIATSGHADNAGPALAALNVDRANAIIVTGDQVKAAKPDPDLFIAAAARLSAPIADALVVGDAVWDMVAAGRAGARGVGLLSGGYGAAELIGAGACRIFDDPADLLAHVSELAPGG